MMTFCSLFCICFPCLHCLDSTVHFCVIFQKMRLINTELLKKKNQNFLVSEVLIVCKLASLSHFRYIDGDVCHRSKDERDGER